MLPIILASATLALFYVMVAPAIDPKRWPLAVDLSRQGLGFAVIGLIVLVVFFFNRPELIPVIILMVAVHEYGHVLAFRMAGHRKPVFRLAPFGGVAFSDKPARSQTESAFIAIMGPGFSIVLVLVGLLAAQLLLPEHAELFWFAPAFDWRIAVEAGQELEPWRVIAISAALLVVKWTAFLNFLNLLPFYPLDGGRAMRSLASPAGPAVADRILYGFTGLLLLLGFLGQNLLLILIAIFGLAGVRQEEALNRRLGALPRGHWLLVAGAYFSMLAFFAYFSAPLLARYLPASLVRAVLG